MSFIVPGAGRGATVKQILGAICWIFSNTAAQVSDSNYKEP